MTALIIPAYKPGEALIRLLEEIGRFPEMETIVVDDGSGEAFSPVFDRLPQKVTLLRHEVNRGKGAALKTAMDYILQNMPEVEIAVTADADGQHSRQDIFKVLEAAKAVPGALTLGSRAFRGEVPLRSRLGNGLTRKVFAVVAGRRVQDTQTGLRAFGRQAMADFLKISGDRYEYEINMLLFAARGGMKIQEVPIETIYIDDNSSSHFHPVRDSLRIYLCIFQFAASSIAAFLLDYALLMLFSKLYAGYFAPKTALFLSVVSARVPSALVNFSLNRKIVFQANEDLWPSLLKYALLAAFILLANYALLNLLNLVLGMPLSLAKLLVEAVLFLVSWVVQGKYVYRKKVEQ